MVRVIELMIVWGVMGFIISFISGLGPEKLQDWFVPIAWIISAIIAGCIGWEAHELEVKK